MKAKNIISIAALLLALGVIIGAFGAHGLQKIVDPSKLVTFETGVRYHFFHAFGLLALGIITLIRPDFNNKKPVIFFITGILLFSFNCYLYTLTSMKTFAMIVPAGGFAFILGWITLFFNARKLD